MADLSAIPTEQLLQMLQPPVNDAPEAAAGTARQTTPGQAVMIGAGRTVDQVIKGAQQVGHTVGNWWSGNLGKPDPMAGPEAENRRIYEALQKEHPASTGFGEALPYAAVPPSLGPVGSSLAIGGTEAMKYGTPEERAMRGGVGAVTALGGALMGNAAGGIASGGSQGLSQTKRDVLAGMRDIQVQPRLSQITDNPYLARVEDWAGRTTGGAGVMQDFARGNELARNRAAARSVGGQADEITPQFLGDTRQRLGAVFNEITALPGRNIQINRNVGTVADDILRQQAKMLPEKQDQALIASAQRARAYANTNARIDGEAYQLIRSGLSESSFDAGGTTGRHYGQLLAALDNSAEQSLRANGHARLAQALREVRPQYANLTTMERGKVTAGGNIHPVQTAMALRQNNPAAFREGRNAENPLVAIGREGETFPPLREGSQTYERGQTGDILSTALKLVPAYLAAQMTTSAIPRAYARGVNAVPGAPGFLSGTTNPAVRALVQSLLAKTAVPLMPVAAEE